jgi:hypothetical protein
MILLDRKQRCDHMESRRDSRERLTRNLKKFTTGIKMLTLEKQADIYDRFFVVLDA